MKRLTIENWQELQPYIALGDYHEYNSNTMTMLMWSSMYDIHFETHPQYAIAYTSTPKHDPIWLMPFCLKEHRKEAVEAIQNYSTQHGIPFEIHSMTKEFKDWLTATWPMEFLIWDCYDARDYVYDRKQQETLSGKKMQKRRNHFNAFRKQYEGRYVYRALDESNKADVYAFLKYWQSQKDAEETIDAEDAGIHLLLENMQDLPIEGGCIYIDGKLEAFTIASRLSKDTIQIHVEKANRMIRGLYIAILKSFLETLEEDIVYVNREDDMGLEKLRKAKTDMQPIFKVHKFASARQPLSIHTADPSWKEKIQALWLQQFQEETTQSTAFYFEHLYHEEACLLLTSQEELLAMMQLRSMDIVLNGVEVRVPFVVGVATNPEYEGCGYMGMLMRYACDTYKQKAPFMLLQAYNWDLYRSFGFYECYHRNRWKLRKQAYEPNTTGSWKESKDAATLLSLYEQFCENKNGYRRRDIAYYEHQLLPYAALWKQKAFLYVEHEIALGYLILEECEDCIHVYECIYQNERVLARMMQMFALEERSVCLDLDVDAQIEGRRKKETCMMVKQLQQQPFPQEHLFIREEL